MHYSGAVYRPPSEARSLIVQCTLGCSHNKCAFCTMYKDKKFSINSIEQVLSDLDEARAYGRYIEKIFLADGDALIHALCDALLGAAAMGDIGLHFPDTSERFKGIDSRILLRHTVEMLRDKGYRIGNVDCTLCLQRPKIKPYIAAMRETLAETMGIDPERVSVKATTTERLGFVGREEGVEAHAVALVYRETP